MSGFRILTVLQNMRNVQRLRVILLVAAVVIVCLFVALAVFSKSRTFVIEAETTAAGFTFQGESNDWYLAGATICRLRDQPDFTRVADTSVCDPRFYEITDQRDLTLQWPNGAKVDVALTNQGDLRLSLQSAGPDNLAEGTILIVTEADWRDTGALTFSAHTTVGRPISAGEQFYLTRGNWEARESGLITSFLRANVTEVIKTGELMRGATASVRSANQPVRMNGHVTPKDFSDTPSLEIFALSQPGDVELHVGYSGTDIPTIIRPDLVDVALSSPLLLAIAIILSMLASLSQVFADFNNRRKQDE
ncbi:hypothetical protein KDD17_02630 [Sulfitobacter albidus]|uniref:Transmembrane protein n=1 Tax=Sulfitobacter albidus TaxID=2829501 RepID=A0A975JFC3_9RHOB|nr:hypothetical protein [Sulfitobacter albidus]QUJ76965.1 hypothetical protein KDD17_02630 [Sulfitobacter albidus]